MPNAANAQAQVGQQQQQQESTFQQVMGIARVRYCPAFGIRT